MSDWKKLVRERIECLGLDSHHEAEIVEELAQELEERFGRAMREGASCDEAESMVRAEIEGASLERALRTALGSQRPRPAAL